MKRWSIRLHGTIEACAYIDFEAEDLEAATIIVRDIIGDVGKLNGFGSLWTCRHVNPDFPVTVAEVVSVNEDDVMEGHIVNFNIPSH